MGQVALSLALAAGTLATGTWLAGVVIGQYSQGYELVPTGEDIVRLSDVSSHFEKSDQLMKQMEIS
ncbi:MAG: hypothetical protein EPO50_16345 [Reyranella sp.]|nr:MAG: hypothetical protein EPO50_16345 [Reyranella sp.]